MIIVYHEGDCDGHCSAAIVEKMVHGFGARLIPMDYGKPRGDDFYRSGLRLVYPGDRSFVAYLLWRNW